MTPYFRRVLEWNAALQAQRETEASYHEPPWSPVTEQEAAAARELADQARARQEAKPGVWREIEDPDAEFPPILAKVAEAEPEAELG
jgi:hypothetical protein